VESVVQGSDGARLGDQIDNDSLVALSGDVKFRSDTLIVMVGDCSGCTDLTRAIKASRQWPHTIAVVRGVGLFSDTPKSFKNVAALSQDEYDRINRLPVERLYIVDSKGTILDKMNQSDTFDSFMRRNIETRNHPR
jgi:hypothetical protein